MMRQCLGLPNHPCSRITDKSRCPECARRYETQRGPRRIKGRYDSEYRKLRERAIREHPWCLVCGHRGSADNPLTADHVVPLVAGGSNSLKNMQVMCRACNSRKGARLSSPPTT